MFLKAMVILGGLAFLCMIAFLASSKLGSLEEWEKDWEEEED